MQLQHFRRKRKFWNSRMKWAPSADTMLAGKIRYRIFPTAISDFDGGASTWIGFHEVCPESPHFHACRYHFGRGVNLVGPGSGGEPGLGPIFISAAFDQVAHRIYISELLVPWPAAENTRGFIFRIFGARACSSGGEALEGRLLRHT